MINTTLKNIPIAMAALAIGSSAFAQTISTVNLRLTESTTGTGLFAKDETGRTLRERLPTFENEYSRVNTRQDVYTYEYGSKVVKYKLSNKEFLEFIRDDVGLIDDIRGWAVVFLTVGDISGIAYITKRGETPIDVSEHLYATVDEPIAIQDSYKYVLTTTLSTNERKLRETGSYKSKELISVTAEFPSVIYNVYGTVESSGRLKTYGTGELQYSEYAPGTQNMKNLAGTAVYENGDDPGVVDGTISAATGKDVDLDDFFAGS
jgi:hypothetical protein